jgi:hypothetical protein
MINARHALYEDEESFRRNRCSQSEIVLSGRRGGRATI